MQSYKQITKAISQQYFQDPQNKQNKALQDIGQTYLQLLAKNIIYFELNKDVHQLQQIKTRIEQIIIQEINLSNQEHLLMCIGKFHRKKDYQVLQAIEQQVKECIKSYLRKINNGKKSSGLFKSQSQLKNEITRYQPKKYEKSDLFKSQSQLKNEITRYQPKKYEKSDLFKSQSQLKNQLTKKQEKSGLFTYLQDDSFRSQESSFSYDQEKNFGQDKQIQIDISLTKNFPYQQRRLLQNSVDASLQQLSQIKLSPEQYQKQEFDYNLSQLIKNLSQKDQNSGRDILVDQFLKNTNGNVALNYFTQHFGFNRTQYDHKHTEYQYQVTATIEFSLQCVGQRKKFKYQSDKTIDKSKKKATQKCSKQVLSVALKRNPRLFQQFVYVVKKKGIRLN